jgi:hypothetical protein
LTKRFVAGILLREVKVANCTARLTKNASPVNEESIGTPALNGGKGRILWRPISAHASANLAG